MPSELKRRELLKASAASIAFSAFSLGACSDPTQQADQKKFKANHKGHTRMQFTNKEYLSRFSKIQSAMDGGNIDCLIFFGATGWFRGDGNNMRYVAGDGSINETDPSFVLMPKTGAPILAGHPMAMGRSFAGTKLSELIDRSPMPLRAGTGNTADAVSHIPTLIKKQGFSKAKIGIVGLRFFPADVYQALVTECPGAEIVDAEALVNQIRLIKSGEEIEFLKRSGAAADRAMTALVEAIGPNVTPHDLRIAADNAFTREGCEPSLQIIWGQPWKPAERSDHSPMRKIQPGDLVVAELTSNYKGYYTQLAIPIVYGGEPEQSYLDMIDVNNRIYNECRAAFRPGITVDQLDKMAKTLMAEYTDDKWYAPFLCQTVDFEQSFLHASNTIQEGVAYMLMPWILWNQGVEGYGKSSGFVGHIAGNTVVCTGADPIDLHATSQKLVVV